MALVVKKLEGETWRQAALRYAAKFGPKVAEAVVETFDELLAQGETEELAAWWSTRACVAFDVAEFEARP